MNFSFDTIITVLVIGSFLVSIAQNLGKAQKKARDQAELDQKLREFEIQRRETNVNTQSYEAYLNRTRAEDAANPIDDFSQPATKQTKSENSFANDLAQSQKPINEQERLRQEMARKMNQVTSRQTVGSSQSNTVGQPPNFEEIIRELTMTVQEHQKQSLPTKSQSKNHSTQLTEKRPAQQKTQRTSIIPTLRPEMTTNVITDAQNENQNSNVRNIGAAEAERIVAAERDGKGAEQVSRSTQTRSWSSATSNDIVRAVIWTEILNPPKSKR